MHDRQGTRINKGDKVWLLATVLACLPDADNCNLEVAIDGPEDDPGNRDYHPETLTIGSRVVFHSAGIQQRRPVPPPRDLRETEAPEPAEAKAEPAVTYGASVTDDGTVTNGEGSRMPPPPGAEPGSKPDPGTDEPAQKPGTGEPPKAPATEPAPTEPAPAPPPPGTEAAAGDGRTIPGTGPAS